MTRMETPETLGYSRPRHDPGTLGDTTAARRPPTPPPYWAGTGREPTTTQPQWLADKINTSRRAARPDTCPKCGAQLLVGPDADQCATTARVDHTPVDHLHEVAALLAGRYSCDLTRGELHHRYPWHTHTANQPHPIHLEHTCTPQTEGRLF